MRTIDKWIIAVDLESNESYVKNGIKFYVPKHEGDSLRDNPHSGILKYAPENSRIPIGSTVYLTSYANEQHIEIDGELCYVVPESKIIAYGDIDNMKAYNCILINPKDEESLKSELIYIPRITQKEPTKAEVLDSDFEYVKKGDTIEYDEKIDFEFFVNAETYYYIDKNWHNRIFKVNGELVNGYEEVKLPEEYIEKNGLRIKNTDKHPTVTTGEYKGKKVFLEKGGKVFREKYINKQFIAAELL